MYWGIAAAKNLALYQNKQISFPTLNSLAMPQEKHHYKKQKNKPPKAKSKKKKEPTKKLRESVVPISDRASKPRNPARSSQLRGVTKHRLTSCYEVHFWDSASTSVTPKNGRTRGRQVYLGSWDSEIDAGKVYDRAAIKL